MSTSDPFLPAPEPAPTSTETEADIDGDVDVDVFFDRSDDTETEALLDQAESAAPGPFHTPAPGDHLTRAEFERDLGDAPASDA